MPSKTENQQKILQQMANAAANLNIDTHSTGNPEDADLNRAKLNALVGVADSFEMHPGLVFEPDGQVSGCAYTNPFGKRDIYPFQTVEVIV